LIVGGQDWISFDGTKEDGVEIFNMYPNTCPPNKSDLDAGLCYERCREGYRGVGPVCWANSVNVGTGKVLEPQSCDDSGHNGWTDTGLFCNEPLRWDSCAFKVFGLCIPFLKGGRIHTKRLVCDYYKDGRENKDGLCYRKCPKDLPNRIPGMPYLCYKGGPLSYGRGVGSVPSLIRFNRSFTLF
jgi:hypothetical protein